MHQNAATIFKTLHFKEMFIL